MDMLESQQHCVSNMNKQKTKCHWCSKLYSSAGGFSNHLWQVHGTDCVQPNADADSRKRRLCDVSEADFNQEDMENIIFEDLDFDCYSETPTEGSDKEVRYVSTDSEYDDEGQHSDTENPQHDPTCRTRIHEHLCPEQDSVFNLYASFRNPVDYRLARFFNSAKTVRKWPTEYTRLSLPHKVTLTYCHVTWTSMFPVCQIMWL